MPKVTRDNESRELENSLSRDRDVREHELHDSYSMEYVNPLSIPAGVKKEGYSYRFVNTGIKGEDTFRVEELAAKGWTPVPADRASRSTLDPLGRNPLSQKYITYKDVILMERPEHYCKRDKARFNQLNENKIKSLRGVTSDDSVEKRPVLSSF